MAALATCELHDVVDTALLTPGLVAHNPSVALAVRVLRIFTRTCLHTHTHTQVLTANAPHATQLAQHLTLLLLLPPSVRSVEVVAQLAAAVPLPGEFLQAYVLSCLDACAVERVRWMVLVPYCALVPPPLQDAQQTRLARLVCVFLLNLLRAKLLDVGDVHLELESFCIEYARMHEAAELYKLLRETIL